MKHLSTAHASIKLVAQEYTGNTASVDEGSANKEGPPPCKQQKLDFSASVPQKLSQRELNGLIGAYIVENMLSISTVESDSFRALIGKIPRKGGAGPPCRKTFSKYIDAEYAKMNSELKKEFEQLEYLATTADIWIAHNKSYLGVTAHWMHPANFQRKKAALACRRFKGRHTHESIAIELDNIHSSFGISHKITATVTDNGSNFVKAFKRYQSVEEDDSVDEEDDEVTFVDMNDALQSRVDEDDDVINLPPHYRCASHILNLVSCSDIEKWILSRPEKAVYRSATAKCTALWNKASRSTVAAETVEDVVAKKLIVPCSTRWNSFYDALARICEISIVDLNTISSKFGSKAITEKEHQFLKEYCIAMKPLTVALDILQGICYHGTLLPTLETLMMKTLELKRALQILVDLPEAIVEAIKARFTEVLDSDSALLAAVTLPRFKLRWLRTQERKDKAKAELLAVCRASVRNEDQQKGTSTTTPTCTNSTVEDAFFSFDDEDDISATAESQVADYLKSGAQGMDSLHGFPLIKRISLKHNAATPSSAPVERLFSLGKLVFTPKRNRLSDLKFEKLLLLRYNHWFTG
uniref:HAT C-terminal dimerisation domain-containing protein n=1 Tax=Astyanax mexicanus TaxID=7994 RepID=A0A3B1JDF9_ASTMX